MWTFRNWRWNLLIVWRICVHYCTQLGPEYSFHWKKFRHCDIISPVQELSYPPLLYETPRSDGSLFWGSTICPVSWQTPSTQHSVAVEQCNPLFRHINLAISEDKVVPCILVVHKSGPGIGKLLPSHLLEDVLGQTSSCQAGAEYWALCQYRGLGHCRNLVNILQLQFSWL